MSSPTSHCCPRCGASLDEHALDGLCVRCLAALNLATETLLPDDDEHVPAAPPPVERIAPHFPQLEILGLLGRGGMGVVYKARQKTLGRLVALKLLAPERVADPKFARRFVQEAQALAALSHPNIVTIHDFGQAGEFYYLLMEFVDGVTLRQAMTAGRFAPEQALVVVPPICEALQYAHDHGVVHRDIKPENLLLDKEGRLKIADFGVAKLLDHSPADGYGAESQPAGTPQYMAPEQLLRRAADHRADIYSLGVVLYEMLTGELPGRKLEPPSRRVRVDVGIDAIVLRALEQSPELRFHTATEFRTQVEKLIRLTDHPSDPSPAAAATAAPSRSTTEGEMWRSGKFREAVAIAAAGFVLVSAMVVTGLIRDGGRQTGARSADEVDRRAAPPTTGNVERAILPPGSGVRDPFFLVRSGKVVASGENAAAKSKANEVGGKLRIRVPAENHDLSPFRGLTAPRLVTKVSGDFEVQVKVTADFKPGPESTGKGNPFNGAGILIWQNDDNFLRIERNAWRQGDSFWCYPPLIEYWRDHEYAGMNVQAAPATYFHGDSTWFKAVRRGPRVTVSMSHDGIQWNEVRNFAVELATEVQVGIAALNTSNESFVVDFEDLRITSNGAAWRARFQDDRVRDGLAEVVGVRKGEDRINVRWEPTGTSERSTASE